MAKWSKDHVSAIGSLTLEPWNISGILLNWILGGALK
jgi:hypothetical protein